MMQNQRMIKSMENLRIALLQVDLVWENAPANRQRLQNWLSDLPANVDLAILPEMFTTGFSLKPEGIAENGAGETLAWMQTEAQKNGLVLAGSVMVEEDGQFYNRMLVVNGDGLVIQYDKRHLFRMAGEHEIYAAGSQKGVFELKGWRICPLICYDLRFPVWSRNQLAKADGLQYDLLFYVANWPERRAAHWRALLQARAIENQAFVAGVNRVGEDGNGLVYSGDTAIFDPLGVALATGAYREQAIVVELDAKVLADYREKFPAWMDADRFDLKD